MKKIEAIVTSTRVNEVKSALDDMGIDGMTVSDVSGFGRRKRQTGMYRGRGYAIDGSVEAKIELVVRDTQSDEAVAAIFKAAKILRTVDGRIFISPIEEAIRIRTDERGEAAL